MSSAARRFSVPSNRPANLDGPSRLIDDSHDFDQTDLCSDLPLIYRRKSVYRM